MASKSPPNATVPKKKVQELTQEEVGYLLTNLGLDKHVETFRKFHVDGVTLAAFKTETDLSTELNMKSHVQRLNLISHIKDFLDVQVSGRTRRGQRSDEACVARSRSEHCNPSSAPRSPNIHAPLRSVTKHC